MTSPMGGIALIVIGLVFTLGGEHSVLFFMDDLIIMDEVIFYVKLDLNQQKM
jgi:hypothetical protein